MEKLHIHEITGLTRYAIAAGVIESKAIRRALPHQEVETATIGRFPLTPEVVQPPDSY